MNILVLSDVQRLLTAPGTGLALLMLLALGTFVAGVHISWQICFLGIIMALAVPAIAWLTTYALFLVLGVTALVGIATTFWWRQSDEDSSGIRLRVENPTKDVTFAARPAGEPADSASISCQGDAHRERHHGEA